MRTKEQKRSEFALKKISLFNNGTPDEKEANFIVGTPTMILANGIAQSMAFLLSKNEDRAGKVFDILKEWLSQEIASLKVSQSNVEFLKRFSNLEQKDYMKAQQEALALLQWLKRYARAFQK